MLGSDCLSRSSVSAASGIRAASELGSDSDAPHASPTRAANPSAETRHKRIPVAAGEESTMSPPVNLHFLVGTWTAHMRTPAAVLASVLISIGRLATGLENGVLLVRPILRRHLARRQGAGGAAADTDRASQRMRLAAVGVVGRRAGIRALAPYRPADRCERRVYTTVSEVVGNPSIPVTALIQCQNSCNKARRDASRSTGTPLGVNE